VNRKLYLRFFALWLAGLIVLFSPQYWIHLHPSMQSTQKGGKWSGGTVGVINSSGGPPNYPLSLNSTQSGGQSIIQLPASVPNVGNLTGAGTTIVPSDFGNPICRITDANTNPSHTDITFVANSGGSGDETLFNTNSSLIIIGDTGGRGYPMSLSFSGTTCIPTRLYANSSALDYFSNPWSASGGFYLQADDPGWSYINPNLLFAVDPTNPAIDSYNFSGATPTGTPPSPTTFVDFRSGQTGSWGTTSTNALASNYAMNWSSFGKQNKYPTASVDQVWTMATSNAYVFHSSSAPSGTFQFLETVTNQTTSETFVFHEMSGNNPVGNGYTGTAGTSDVGDVLKGNTSGATITLNASGVTKGGQDTGTDWVIYVVGKGFMHLDTSTGAITADPGFAGGAGLTCSPNCTGNMGISDRFTSHNAKISKDGSRLLLASAIPLGGTTVTSDGPYQWTIGTATVAPGCTDPNKCSGHWTEGAQYFANNDGGVKFEFSTRLFGNNSTPTTIPMGLPWTPGTNSCTLAIDQHPGWSNTDVNDTLPFITTFYDSAAPTGWNPFICALEDEVDGIARVSGTVYRFGHTFNTEQSPVFSTGIAVGSPSTDGRFYMFSSDWMGTLGGTTGTTGCTLTAPIAGNYCRGDVFVVQLR
jgi:hypothetical protein